MTRKYEKREFTSEQLTQFANNLHEHLVWCVNNLSATQFIKAHSWYANERLELERLVTNKVSYATVCAVVAVLSPRNEWGKNKADAKRCIDAYTEGKTECPKTGMRIHQRQVYEMLWEGKGIRQVTKGNKVLSFYTNLRYALNDSVTIDRHMLRVFEGITKAKEGTLEQNKLADVEYKQLANIVKAETEVFWDVYHESLRKLMLMYTLPYNVQSIAWVGQLVRSSTIYS